MKRIFITVLLMLLIIVAGYFMVDRDENRKMEIYEEVEDKSYLTKSEDLPEYNHKDFVCKTVRDCKG